MLRKVVSLALALVLTSLLQAQVSKPDGWAVRAVIAEHVPAGRVGVHVRGLVDPDRGPFVVWSQGKIGAWSLLVAARDGRGDWHQARIASTDQATDPEPQIARASDGTLVVAWGGSVEKPGSGFCVRQAGSERWTRPQALHPGCEGRVALSSGKNLTAAYVRPVTKVDLKRILGDFIHDRPVQGFDKPAVAGFDGTGWNEAAVLETKNLFRCDHPAIVGKGLIYFRQLDDEHAQLAWSTLTGKEEPLIISRSPAFRFGTDAAVAIQNGQPVVAFHDEAGVVLVRRTRKCLGKPMLLHRGWGHGIRVAATPAMIHVAFAAGANRGIRHVAVTGQKDPVVTTTLSGWSCDLCVDQEQPCLFISQQEKVTDATTALYRIVMVRRVK